ncbi:A disintegrin and metalloproteinase with thrombospondin motifs 9-like isoform X2 [Neocloeon triangulifer]|uniref:A disintegrin and metalloproteinase with thrombospondin motifs 9-like isoform X2 n=1 Tax=Neocloeon triangulifer TaxID=2078957 RepID=UPI00286ECE85|nr:A disintegrin and metalloproteinase with thrombospondin motifs 9-like isoform X2 [Neocloeon triangulifer]
MSGGGSSRRSAGAVRDVLVNAAVTLVIVLLAVFLYVLWIKIVPGSTAAGGTFLPPEHRNASNANFDEQRGIAELRSRVRQNKSRKLSVNTEQYEAKKQLAYFIPTKLPSKVPLHEHDVLYGQDELWRKAGKQHVQLPKAFGKKQPFGHFIHKDDELWDPTPQYEFNAFGHHFHLELKLDASASSATQTLRAHHVFRNHSHVLPIHKDASRCFYSGKVLGDASSRVNLNLCHGMFGYIRTSHGIYFVEPSEYWPPENATDVPSSPSVMHAMYPLVAPAGDADQPEESHCAVPHSPATDHVDDQPQDEENSTHHRVSRSLLSYYYATKPPGSVSKQLYIEVKVVTDRKMHEYHGDGLTQYVMTLMSIVSSLFKDASIGNHVNIKVVDIENLADTSFFASSDVYWKSKYNSNDVWATEMLKKFCIWQNENRHTRDRTRQYDTALLLTRENLCRYNNLTSCGTLGLAEVGAACNPKKSCSIVQDNGLSAAFTIAHELGHVLNMKHDNDNQCKRFMEPKSRHYMMAHMLGENTFPWEWSNCSRHYLTEFLESGQGYCLENEPHLELPLSVDSSLPGENFNHNRQCEMLYGPGSRICTYMPSCNSLWCSQAQSDEQNGCLSQHIPWADGTMCAHNSWCQKGRCVPKNREALTPRDGGWSTWGPFGVCSRSCGGGIKQAKRECDNPRPENGGKYCIGERVRYHSCNTQDCPYNQKDFRDQQCSNFRKGYGEGKWIAKYFSTAEDQCKLYCRQGTDFQHLFAEKVVDGTPCSPKTNDICINGKCHPAGCDHILGSNKTLDSCGVCDGDNSTCTMVTGTYNGSIPEYQKVVEIPAGSTSIFIKQTPLYYADVTAGDNIHLALKLKDTGQYILNGNFNIRPYATRLLDAGTPISYNGARSYVEIINSTLESLKVAIILEVFIAGTPVAANVEYQYMVHFPYIWKPTSDWSTCHKTCFKQRSLGCFERRTNIEVDKYLCNNSTQEKPQTKKICNLSHCKIYWKGSRCIHLINNYEKEVDKRFCEKVKAVPRFFKPAASTYRWEYGTWSECGVGCNPGNQTRSAKCLGYKNRYLPDQYCPPLNPIDTVRMCEVLCYSVWKTGDWTKCSAKCGSGYQRRSVWCELDGFKVNTEQCPGAEPSSQRECVQPACGYWKTGPSSVTTVKFKSHNSSDLMAKNVIVPAHSPLQIAWVDGEWSECSVSCGKGYKRRIVQCLNLNSNDVLSDALCEQLSSKPMTQHTCSHTCGTWRPREWQPCSATCGKGMMKRQVVCESEWGRLSLPDTSCGNQEKPVSEHSCELKPCTMVFHQQERKWSTGSWGECIVVNKDCGVGTRRRQVRCLHGVCDGDAPPDIEPCVIPCRNARWNFGEWGECSRPCGTGHKYRLVRCQSVDGQFLNEEECPVGERPTNKQECNTHRCNGYRWKVGAWEQCSLRCGRGVKRRTVQCVSSGKGAVEDFHCSGRKPPDTRFCFKYQCPYSWQIGDWSECSSTCGSGVQTRQVTCHKVVGLGWLEPSKVPDGQCYNLEKPAATQACHLDSCSLQYHWMTGPWKPCSAVCGKRGKKRRAVHCVGHDRLRVPNSFCRQDKVPARKAKCNVMRCPGPSSCREVKFLHRHVATDGTYTLNLFGMNVSVYCHEMTSHNPKEYLTLPTGEMENYSEFYHLSLKNPNTCPLDGKRLEKCDFCYEEKKGLSGTTVFTKIRFNPQSLKVTRDDFTFARLIRGRKYIPYGEAGDCYSNVLCPQGRFSVNLSGTPFRVSPTTGWISNGGSMDQHPDEEHQKVWGKCGGNCGTCSPRKETGLKLELLWPDRHLKHHGRWRPS